MALYRNHSQPTSAPAQLKDLVSSIEMQRPLRYAALGLCKMGPVGQAAAAESSQHSWMVITCRASALATGAKESAAAARMLANQPEKSGSPCRVACTGLFCTERAPAACTWGRTPKGATLVQP